MEEQLTPFVDTLLRDKELSGMTREVFAQLRHDLVADLRQQVDRAIIDAFDDDQAVQFEKLLNSPSTTEAELQDFVTSTCVNASEVIAHTMIRFREYYLGEE